MVRQRRASRCRILALLAHAASHAMADGKEMGPVVFKNFLRHDFELRWLGRSGESVAMGQVPSMGDTSLGKTYEGHVFRLVRPGAAGAGEEVEAEFRMEAGRNAYTVGPDPGDAEALVDPRYMRHLQEQESSKFERALGRLHQQGELKAVSLMRSVAAAAADVGMGIVVKNFRRWPVQLFYDDGSPSGAYNGEVPAMAETASITSFPGHAFNVMRKGSDGELERVTRFVMDRAVRNYVLEPEEQDMSHPDYLKHLKVQRQNAEYLKRTGLEWLGAQPPDPPTLPMYAPGSELGAVAHTVKVRRRRKSGDEPSHDTIHLRALTWNPHGPRLFLLEGLLDQEECQHIIGEAEDRLGEGRVGGSNSRGFSSKTRTSKVAFLPRSASPMLEAIHERFADALNVTDKQLRASAEPLQVVRYLQRQEYSPHSDYEPTSGLDRLATLLVYLETAESGGGTSFPRAFADRGIEVRPKQGDAILFYSMLPDGNMDELALHAGMPVVSGMKRVCNLWMHSHGDKPDPRWAGAEL
uniref:Fe2OG dioxygenase domain-containing protein n=1 Tax=Alexandrium monilatum TaxID=311494 RepID=A0A7S4UA26_9DINO